MTSAISKVKESGVRVADSKSEERKKVYRLKEQILHISSSVKLLLEVVLLIE